MLEMIRVQYGKFDEPASTKEWQRILNTHMKSGKLKVKGMKLTFQVFPGSRSEQFGQCQSTDQTSLTFVKNINLFNPIYVCRILVSTGHPGTMTTFPS